MRYRPSRAEGGTKGVAARARARILAPIGGSRWLFPRALARHVAARSDAGSGRFVGSLQAQHFFADRLVFPIDPARLQLRLLDRVQAGDAEIWLSDRFVDGADWSDVMRPIAQLAEHRDMLQLVSFGQRYPEMPIFRDLTDRIRSGNPARRYGKPLDTEEKLHAYFRYFLQLTESIRDHGFQEQSRLAPGQAQGVDVRGKWAARQRDIGVAIAADGMILRFLGGRHRTAIAQALSVPAVPVEIRLVHREWLAAQAEKADAPPEIALLKWVSSQEHRAPA